MPMTLENRKQKTEIGLSDLRPPTSDLRGFTLIELMVSIGLFSIIVLLTASAYFMMLSINRQTQGIATGINNLSFALETMTRDIRTGTVYSSSNGSSFTFTPAGGGATVTYSLSGSAIQRTISNVTSILTDPSVNITSLAFYLSGATPGDSQQPHVTIIISGTVSYGPGKTQPFTVETGATMRGTDL